WGVPRYDASTETETYMVDGQMLTPVAHRGTPVARSADKIFHTRVEGGFRKIIRHGNHPNYYWWEVIDKNGTRFFYGSEGNGIYNESVLAENPGSTPVYKWLLRKVQDSNGNTMTYSYDRVADNGMASSSAPGVQLYLSEIRYTGHGSDRGAYSVRFIRDSVRRPDVTISGRSGFKIVSAGRLKRIEVKFKEQLVRAYELDYRLGAFNKSLLQSVKQLTAANEVFNTHTFDYYNDVEESGSTYAAFREGNQWTTGSDSLQQKLGESGKIEKSFESSVLGSSRGDNKGTSMRDAWGFTPAHSIGWTDSTDTANSETQVAFMDINGDSLPDKVFKKNGRIYYRRNTANPQSENSVSFADPVEIQGLSTISSSQTVSTGRIYNGTFNGWSAYDGLGNTTTIESVYFADVNGDGLIDAVSNGQVLFNHLDAQGRPVFTNNSFDTAVPVGGGTVSAGDLLPDLTALKAQMEKENPLLDTVRRWEVPYDGVIRITGNVALIRDDSEARAAYLTADGVRVAIQHKTQELWAKRISANDYGAHTPANVGNINVKKGEYVYFRVQSVNDGSYDKVNWSPEIVYTDKPTDLQDENGLNPYRYNMADDFILSGKDSDFSTPYTGVLRLQGKLHKKAKTSDDITIALYKEGKLIHEQLIGWDYSGEINIDKSFEVEKYEMVGVRLNISSTIDMSQIEWSPKLYYTSVVQDAEQPVDDDGNPILDADGNQVPAPTIEVKDADGNYILQMSNFYDADIYPLSSFDQPAAPWTADKDGMIFIQPTYNVAYTSGVPAVTEADLWFVVKRNGQPIVKELVLIKDGAVETPHKLAQFIQVNKGDKLYFSFNTNYPEFKTTYGQGVVNISYGSRDNWQVPATGSLAVEPLLGFNGNPDELNGTIYMYVRRNGEVIKQQVIGVDKGVLTPSVSALQFTTPVTKNDTLTFEYYTDTQVLKDKLADNQINLSYADTSNGWSAPVAGDINITPVLNFTTTGTAVSSGEIQVVIHKNNQSVAEAVLTIKDGKIEVGDELPIKINVAKNDQLRLSFKSGNPTLVSSLLERGANIEYFSTTTPAPADMPTETYSFSDSLLQIENISNSFSYDAPMAVIHRTAAEVALFSQAYRGWSQVAYNGGGDRATAPINPDLLKIKDAQEPGEESLVYNAIPDTEFGRWGSGDDDWWVSKGAMSSTRLGTNYLVMPDTGSGSTTPAGNNFAPANRPNRMSAGDSKNKGGGATLTVNLNNGRNYNNLALLDMNGDRYPDIVGNGVVQYTLPNGGLDNRTYGLGTQYVRHGESDSKSITIGFAPSNETNDQAKESNQNQSFAGMVQGSVKAFTQALNQTPTASPGFSIGGGKGESEGSLSYMDMNGDGLPDRVRQTGKSGKSQTQVWVELNMGYGRFGAQ
ncbi:MAG: hypothetical protein OEY07_19410, partial [Gammaproteobacteria bacterium]|nr:hypothetical protein [Gammaproteobacteria bacterium]